MFLYLLTVLVSLLICTYNWKLRKLSKLSGQFKQLIKSYPILGVAYLFFGNCETHMKAIQWLGKLTNENGGVATFWMGPHLFLMVTDAETADLLLKTNLEKHYFFKLYSKVLGNGNIVAPVPIWRPRRQQLMPLFTPKNLTNFIFPVIIKNSAIMIEKLNEKVGKGPFAIYEHLSTNTMDTVCESVLGVQLNSQKTPDQPFLNACNQVHKLLLDKAIKPWLHNDFIHRCFSNHHQLMKSMNYINIFITKIIQTKRKEVENSKSKDGETIFTTFLEQLIQADVYSDVELCEELLVVVMAAIDTTALVAGYTLFTLASNPDIQEKVCEELHGVFGDSDRPVVLEDLQNLKYLEAVIKESMRLYPPVSAALRTATKEVILPSGVKLVEGCGIMVNICALHRNRLYWGDDAEQFRPERFLDTPLKHPAQYMPFSYGPRNCPGFQYALISLKSTLSSLLRKYRVLPPEDEPKPLRLTLHIVMKDADNFLLRFEDRNGLKPK